MGKTRPLDLPQGHLPRFGFARRSILGVNLYSDRSTMLQGKFLPRTGNLLFSRKVFEAIGVFDASMRCI